MERGGVHKAKESYGFCPFIHLAFLAFFASLKHTSTTSSLSLLSAHRQKASLPQRELYGQRTAFSTPLFSLAGHRFHTPGKLQLDGPVDKALIAASEEEAVHLVGLQVPLGTKGVPGHVLGLIRACRGAVLVYRDTAVATGTSAATLTT